MLIPFYRSAPYKYVERKRKKVEITSVDYKVGVMVRFRERFYLKPIKTEFDFKSCDADSNIVVGMDYETIKEPVEVFKFALKVKLSADEYKENAFSYKGKSLKSEEEYVINRAKNTYEFKRNMNDLLACMPKDREYEVDIFVLWEEVDGKKVNTEVIDEWTEYVAEY